jgi:glycosyltransferase involved in cell wall biosynthesis
MSRLFRAQIPVVRRLLTHASLVVVPSAAMADRVVYHVPAVADRMIIRPHPISPIGRPRLSTQPFILVPVVPGPYKNLSAHLRLLVTAADSCRHPVQIRLTANAEDLPDDLVAHPRITTIGTLPHREIVVFWRTAWAAFYPSSVESFGYPLAEARAYGIPVIAPDSSQAREIAGAALRGYDPSDPATLHAALAAADQAPEPDPSPFDRDSYFRWLLAPEESATERTR